MAYRTLGKDPSRDRGSQESLFRRVSQGQGLYTINTVVDINNLTVAILLAATVALAISLSFSELVRSANRTKLLGTND